MSPGLSVCSVSFAFSRFWSPYQSSTSTYVLLYLHPFVYVYVHLSILIPCISRRSTHSLSSPECLPCLCDCVTWMIICVLGLSVYARALRLLLPVLHHCVFAPLCVCLCIFIVPADAVVFVCLLFIILARICLLEESPLPLHQLLLLYVCLNDPMHPSFLCVSIAI